MAFETPTHPVCLALAGWLLLANVLGALAIALDKRAAAAHARRVPERRLLLVAVAGGWPAMAAAMAAARHKTRKAAFLAPFWAAAALATGWVWYALKWAGCVPSM